MKKNIILVKLSVTFMLLLLCVTFLSSSGLAAKGNFQINNQVIYEKDRGSLTSTTTFTINQLFLNDMSEIDKQTAKESQKIITSAKNEVFTKETPKLESIDKKVTPQLFAKGYTMTEEVYDKTDSNQRQSELTFIILCLVGGILVVFLGICLGRLFPRLLKST